MNTIIYKYQLAAFNGSIQGTYMPKGADIKSAQWINGFPCIWAEVDPEEAIEMRNFLLIWTGYTLPSIRGKRLFISTMLGGDGLVWHLYEIQD